MRTGDQIYDYVGMQSAGGSTSLFETTRAREGSVSSRNQSGAGTPSSIAESQSPAKDRSSDSGNRSGQGRIDRQLLDQAQEILESLIPDDADILVRLDSLSGIVCELWRSAAKSSQYHRQVLTAVETAVRVATKRASITSEQISAIRQGILDLGLKTLTQAHIDSIASHLLDSGISPLAPLGGLETSAFMAPDEE